MRSISLALSAVGWILLGIVAAAGVALSAAALYATSPVGRPVVAREVIRRLDAAVAGTLDLDAIEVLPRGGVEIRGLRVYAPGGRRVLSVERARVFLDLTRLRARSVGVALELERPVVDLSLDPEGRMYLAQAFSPERAGAPAAGPAAAAAGPGGWTVRVTGLSVKAGAVRYPRDGGRDIDASEVAVHLAGEVGPGGGFVDGRLRGRLEAPIAAPVEMDVSATLDGTRLAIPVLRARVGGTALDLVGDGDVVRRSGRVAITRLGIDRAEVAALVPRAEVPGLQATAYAESDGRIVTAAARARPDAPGAPGRADAAVAMRLDGTRAAGFDLAADRLDPSALVSFAPAGRVTLDARGAVAGTALRDLVGRIELALAPSSLRGADIGPARVVASARAGTFQVTALDAAAPGLRATGSGAWRAAGALGGDVTVDVSDLQRAGRNLARLLGVEPPPLAGRGRVTVVLSGTARAPSARIAANASALRTGAVALAGVQLEGELSGTLRAPVARVDVSAARGTVGDTDASAIVLRASIGNGLAPGQAAGPGPTGWGEATIALSASVPRFGRDPVAVQARGRAGPAARTLEVTELVVAYPGTRYALVQPARVVLAGPRVDHLELAAGAQRIGLEGGVDRGRVDARLWVAHLDLRALPRGLLPNGAAIAGDLSLEARATGRARQRTVAGTVALAGGSFRGLAGLQARGNIRWSGADRRIVASLGVQRAAGGTFALSLDAPTSFVAARPSERVEASLRGEQLPAAEILRALGAALPAGGTVDVAASVTGTAAAPALSASAEVLDGVWRDIGGLHLHVEVEDAGRRGRAAGTLDRAGVALARADVELPVDLGDVLARTSAAASDIRRAPLRARAFVPDVDLAALAGRAGLPQRLAGRLDAAAELEGTLEAPRGRARAALQGAALAGWSGVDVAAEAALSAERTSLTASASLGGDRVLQVDASLGAPPERLVGRDAIGRAPLRADIVVPRVALARAAGPDVPVTGTIEGRLTASGTLARPLVEAQAGGAGVAVRGKPLGTFTAWARYGDGRTSADLSLKGAGGGTLTAAGSLTAELGLGAPPVHLAQAPATARVTATDLDLSIVPALAPGLVRTASGVASLDLSAAGPLASMRPRGTVRVANGRLAVTEYGDWTQIAVDATLGDDVIEVARASAHRGSGRVELKGSVRGLASGTGTLDAHATVRDLALARAGMELATLDLQADTSGTVRGRSVDATVTIPRGTVRLPPRSPRALQPIDSRPDIAVGRAEPREQPTRPGAPGAAAAGGAAQEPPLDVKIHVVAPGRLLVKSDSPRVNLDLKADTTFELQSSDLYAEGSIEVIRGSVEPIAGRNFDIERGRVQFTGGPPRAALLDVQAKYVNPQATVEVAITGPATAPEIHLSSQPPMDDATIALLIATGRTEFRPGSGGMGSATGQEAGMAILGALATRAFKDLIANKLPVDTVSLDASALRAGKYIGDKFYVGYSRNFEAQPELGQNQNEVRIEYQITPRWTFQSRYGDAQSGSASIIWQKHY